MFQVTDSVFRKIQSCKVADVSLAEKALRISLKTGGCSGFEYDFTFDQPKPEDSVVSKESLRVVVDPKSLEHLKDSTLDYVETVMGSEFKISNPQVKSTCGCGKSIGF